MGKMMSRQMTKEIRKTVRMQYWLSTPSGYEEEEGKKWPLILFLHGSGERGDDLEKVKKHGIPKVAEVNKALPFITSSPQCPQGSNWNMEEDAVMSLLDELITSYRIDHKRVYLTGLSMGGYGSWGIGAKYPERFAAVAPICGGGDPQRVCGLRDVPVWAFHGAKDRVVTIDQTESMVKSLEACGGKVRFTVYPEADHNCWTETYNNPDLYDWFLEQAKE